MYRVLIVEDDPMVAMIHQEYMSRNVDFQIVGVCHNGADALKFLAENEVDLVVLDVYMPQMDGIEFLRRLREEQDPVAVLPVTAANDNETVTKMLSLGAIDYLVKPFTHERFQQALELFKKRIRLLKNSVAMNQDSIDLFMGMSQHTIQAQATPKGLQEVTLSRLMQSIESIVDDNEWFTGDQLAKDSGLSTVTIRRYMNYLVKSGVMENKMDYETGGRPRLLYRKSQ